MDLHMIAIFLAAAFAVRSSALYPGKCFIYEVWDFKFIFVCHLIILLADNDDDDVISRLRYK